MNRFYLFNNGTTSRWNCYYLFWYAFVSRISNRLLGNICCADRSWIFIFGHGKVVENQCWKRVGTLFIKWDSIHCGRWSDIRSNIVYYCWTL